MTFAIEELSTSAPGVQGRPASDAGEARRGPATTAGASAAGGGDGGLSKAHNGPWECGPLPVDPEPSLRGGRVTVYKGGRVIEARRERVSTGRRYGGGFRGKVTMFSGSSRRRMMRLLGVIDQTGEPPLFVHLTYPGEWPKDGRVWKRHLNAFDRRLKRAFPGVGYIWRLEAQKRGAPHFHIFTWGVTYDELLPWVGQAWYEVVGSGDERHLRAGTRIERLRSWRGAMSYASKYLGKLGDPLPSDCGWEVVGRFWGVRGAANIPWAEPEVVGATDVQLSRVMRALRRSVPKRKRRRLTNLPAITIFVGAASFWLARLDALMGAPF